MTKDSVVDVEEKRFGRETDLGPWCVGLPSTGLRPLTEAERNELRRFLYGRLAFLGAWLLSLPAFCLAFTLIWHLKAQDAMPLFMLGGLIEIFILIVLPATPENPVGRAIVTFIDYHQGVVEHCEGEFEGRHSTISSPILNNYTALADIRTQISEATEKPASLDRFPRSGRLWAVNGKRIKTWLEAEWNGLAKVASATSSEVKGPYSFSDGIADSIGCGAIFPCIFVTIVVYNIWSPPWYNLIFAFFSLMSICVSIIVWLNRRPKKR